jgi:hypothetical protein
VLTVTEVGMATDEELDSAPFVDFITDLIPYPELSDRELRMRVLEGDRKAVEEAIRRYR